MKINLNGKIEDIKALWREDNIVKMIDQRKLPHSFEILSFQNHMETSEAIKTMVTRGAGAVGNAAGFAMAQAALEAQKKTLDEFNKYLNNAAETIRNTRPTATNLFKAISRCLKVAQEGTVPVRVENVLNEADEIFFQDLKASEKIAKAGSKLINDGFKILTHCNAGALAYVDHGTALAPIRQAVKEGKDVFVWVDETRPRGQGARITTWELDQEGIPYALIADNAAGHFMQIGEVDMVIVGADRIALNGDVANKIGTYEKAIVAYENKIPFWVAAPGMTFDLNTLSGAHIEIEERDSEEVKNMWGIDDNGNVIKIRITAETTEARNPAFDITPEKFLTGFITEYGILKRPFEDGIKRIYGSRGLV
jgi:S-methyl-5-thioribose-1-phosphate isomerase